MYDAVEIIASQRLMIEEQGLMRSVRVAQTFKKAKDGASHVFDPVGRALYVDARHIAH